MYQKGYIFKKNNDFCIFQKRRKNIFISLYSINNASNKYSKNWLFGYNIKDETFLYSKDYEVLDFVQLLHSSNPSKLLKRTVKFFQSRFGYRFVDYKHRDYFTIKPPKIIS